MRWDLVVTASLVLVLAGCGAGRGHGKFKKLDLAVHHPSQYSNYMLIMPGSSQGRLPTLNDIHGAKFSRYLQSQTGCVRDALRSTTTLGDPDAPAGYVLPIACP